MDTTCGRCGRKITSARALRTGYGSGCWTKVRAAEKAEAAATSSRRTERALELLEDKAMVQIRPHIFRSVSSDGTKLYTTAVTGQCTCPDGKRTRPYGCYHATAARMLAA